MAIYTLGCEVGEKVEVQDCLSYFGDKEEMNLDTETTGTDPHVHKITSLQLGDSKNQFFIDCRSIDVGLFKELIESKKIIGQNLKFDYKMLKKVGIVLNELYDTMLAECVLYCGYEKYGYSLADLHRRYLSIELSKEERMSFLTQGTRPFTLRQIEYGCRDIENLGRIRDFQTRRVEELGLGYCLDVEFKAMPALADIEYNGMILDSEDWLKVTKIHVDKMSKIQESLDQIIQTEPKLKKFKPDVVQGNLFGEPERVVKVNYNSPKQVLDICHALGYPVENTNEREIKKLARLNDETGEVVKAKHPFFGLLLQSRETAKVISTYGEKFLKYINPATGRVHTSFWQVQATGRVSSGFKGDNAPNLQNIPAKNIFRNCFKARRGFSWASIDYSGQELAIMADQSGEPVFVLALNNKEDIHSISASLLYGKPITKKDKKERTAAKTITFGLCYGMGAEKLADSLGIEESEAKDLMDNYKKAFPTVIAWLEKSGKSAVLSGKTVTQDLCQRIRWYPEAKRARELRKTVKKGDKATWKEILITEGSTEREGKNHFVQGTAANCTKEALILVRDLILKYNKQYHEEVAFLICTVHDAIDVEVRDDLADQFSKEMAEEMLKAADKYVKTVKMGLDVTVSKEWCK